MDMTSYDLPLPTPLIGDVPEADPFPVSELGPLETVARAVHDKTQAPIAIGAQSALSVAALAVQGLADVETLGGPAPLSLFALTLAKSGERKSACDRLLMAAVHEFQRELKQDHRDELEKHQAEQLIWDAKRSDLLKGVKKGDVPAEIELRSLGPAPEPPLAPVICPGDPTFEGLVKLFAGGRPSLGVFNDEGGAFIGGHAMNTDNRLKTMAGLSALWNGEPVNRTRAADGAESHYGKRLSCHLMVQPEAATGLLGDPVALGQGFLPRFLICHPQSAIGSRLATSYRAESDVSIARFNRRIADLLRKDLPLREGTRNELEPRLLSLPRETKALLQAFGVTIEKAQAPDADLSRITGFASKGAEQAARIAGVLTLFDDPDAQAVTLEAMTNGIELTQYYLGEALRLCGASGLPGATRRAEEWRCWLRDKWGEPYISVRVAVKRGPYHLRETQSIRAAFHLLADHDWLIPCGKPVKVADAVSREAWRLHDAFKTDRDHP